MENIPRIPQIGWRIWLNSSISEESIHKILDFLARSRKPKPAENLKTPRF